MGRYIEVTDVAFTNLSFHNTYHHESRSNGKFTNHDPHSGQGVLDTTLCDKVCQ
jgi:hypothetical protein